MALIFDIETIGILYDELDETTKHSLTRWIEREAGEDQGKYNVMLADLKESLGFSPLTGEIVTIGIFDDIKNQGAVYYSDQGKMAGGKNDWVSGNFTFKIKNEKEMLESFWQGAKFYSEFVSFNGRSFDVPFLLLRSAVHRLKPTKDLMSNRYLSSQNYNAKHIDLLDQLSFYGAVRRKGNLHLYCRALGLASPKARGIAGDDVESLYRQGKARAIAEYNSWDLMATAELYKIWRDYIKIKLVFK